MELKILSVDGKEAGKKKLPAQFLEEIREDIVKKSAEAIQANSRQAYGAKPDAGKRASAELSRRRHKYRGAYGYGISRVPRKIMSRRGERLNWVGAFAPGTVGGRKAHPPKASKKWSKKINKKENRKAIRSAIAATIAPEIVKNRGHAVPEGFPFIIDSKFEAIAKANDAKKAFLAIGLGGELKRASKKTIRAGKGKSRGRKYKCRKGPVFVVSGKCGLAKAAGAIPGIDVVEVRKLNAECLAPGCHTGRLAFFTDKAIEKMEKDGLFR